MQKFKEGQKVKVVDCIHAHGFKLNETVDIIAYDPEANDNTGDYLCSNGKTCWFLTNEELGELI